MNLPTNSVKTLLAKFKAQAEMVDSKGVAHILQRGTKKELSTGITLVGNGYEDYENTWMDIINKNFISLNTKIEENANTSLSGDISVLESLFNSAEQGVA